MRNIIILCVIAVIVNKVDKAYVDEVYLHDQKLVALTFSQIPEFNHEWTSFIIDDYDIIRSIRVAFLDKYKANYNTSNKQAEVLYVLCKSTKERGLRNIKVGLLLPTVDMDCNTGKITDGITHDAFDVQLNKSQLLKLRSYKTRQPYLINYFNKPDDSFWIFLSS